MMKICELCGTEFPIRPVVDGKRLNWQRRRYCQKCSPVGEHNTKRLHDPLPKKTPVYKCRCGANKPEEFYNSNRQTHQCAKCRNKENTERGQRTRERARKMLGAQCMACGFSKWIESLDFHHFESSLKDHNWKSMRSWSWNRVEKELRLGILLCRNCHGALHSGIEVFNERCEEALDMQLIFNPGVG